MHKQVRAAVFEIYAKTLGGCVFKYSPGSARIKLDKMNTLRFLHARILYP